MELPNLQSALRSRVFWVTKRIALGQFATPQRAAILRDQGATHVLNVGEGNSIISADEFGFTEICDIHVVDLERISDSSAISALDAIHRMLSMSNSRVFVHCIAGQNRSPTIVWLYFIACGMSPDDARTLICEHSPDSVPGHSKLVDERLVALVTSHGAENYLPLADPLILQPAYY